jgi:hypothetical protein
MKTLLQILTVLLLTNTAFAQTDTSRYYKLSDNNFWIGKTYILQEPIWNITNWNFIDNASTCFDSIIIFLKNNPKLIVEIGYHTDSRPIPMTLDTLSKQRAKLIKGYLVSNGISPTRIFPQGYGDHVPRIIEKDTNIIITDEINIKCRNKTFFLKKNTVLNDNYIKTIQDPCFRELTYYLNRRPEMKIIEIK